MSRCPNLEFNENCNSVHCWMISMNDIVAVQISYFYQTLSARINIAQSTVKFIIRKIFI